MLVLAIALLTEASPLWPPDIWGPKPGKSWNVGMEQGGQPPEPPKGAPTTRCPGRNLGDAVIRPPGKPPGAAPSPIPYEKCRSIALVSIIAGLAGLLGYRSIAHIELAITERDKCPPTHSHWLQLTTMIKHHYTSAPAGQAWHHCRDHAYHRRRGREGETLSRHYTQPREEGGGAERSDGQSVALIQRTAANRYTATCWLTCE